jgi:hypothetical protein
MALDRADRLRKEVGGSSSKARSTCRRIDLRASPTRYPDRCKSRAPLVPRLTGVTPGVLSVIHAELGDGRFSFTLQLVHPRFGLLMRQMAAFREAER